MLLWATVSIPAGLSVIATLPLAAWLQLLIALLWVVGGIREYRDLRSGAGRVDRFELDAIDRLAAVAADGRRTPLTLLPGSLVLSHHAWLRVRFPDGRHYVEWLHRSANAALDWQRLTLVWRLRRTVVGAQDGS